MQVGRTEKVFKVRESRSLRLSKQIAEAYIIFDSMVSTFTCFVVASVWCNVKVREFFKKCSVNADKACE